MPGEQIETPTPPTPDIPEPDNAVEVPGRGRMVPVSAVIEERRGRQAERQQREQLDREVATLRQKAENYDVLEPYIPLLATHPEVTGKKSAPAPATQPDPELVTAAEALGFYKDDGTPDTDRAAKAKGFFQTLTRSTVEEAVRPVAHTAAQTRATSLRERAYQVVDKQGRPFAAREHIDAVLNELPPESAANPEIVNVALMVARGMGIPATTNEPLHTEGLGGGTPGSGRGLTGLEQAAARARGLTDEQWVKARDARTDDNVLE